MHETTQASCRPHCWPVLGRVLSQCCVCGTTTAVLCTALLCLVLWRHAPKQDRHESSMQRPSHSPTCRGLTLRYTLRLLALKGKEMRPAQPLHLKRLRISAPRSSYHSNCIFAQLISSHDMSIIQASHVVTSAGLSSPLPSNCCICSYPHATMASNGKGQARSRANTIVDTRK